MTSGEDRGRLLHRALTGTIVDCDSPLHLVWTMDVPLYTDAREDVPTVADGYTRDWEVRCEGGHVVLLPAEHGCCPCGDEARNGAEAGPGHDDFDGPGDDQRTFRHTDAARLFLRAGAGQWTPGSSGPPPNGWRVGTQ